jgi:hypothetical protein
MSSRRRIRELEEQLAQRQEPQGVRQRTEPARPFTPAHGSSRRNPLYNT